MPREDRMRTEARPTPTLKGSRPLKSASGGGSRQGGRKKAQRIHMDRIQGEKRLGSRGKAPELQAARDTARPSTPMASGEGSVDGDSEAGLMSPRWAGGPACSA